MSQPRLLSYPERIRMFVHILTGVSDIDKFEERFEEDMQMFSSFRPVEKQCRLAMHLYRKRKKIQP